MAEYICREDVLDNSNIITVQTKEYGSIEVIPVDTIADIELADVQPIKHGRWNHNTSKYIGELDAYFIQACCSCCGKYSDRVDSYSQLMSNEYCSHCGAKIMDGDTND